MTDAHRLEIEQLLNRLKAEEVQNFPLIQALEAALAPQTAPPMVHSVIDPRLDQRLPTMAIPPDQPPPPTEEEP